MRLNQTITKTKYSAGVMIGVLCLLLLMAVILPSGFFMRPIDRSEISIPSSIVQENVGYRILVLARFDQDRQAQLQRQWQRTVQQAKAFENGRTGRLQETLGQAIAQTAQMILSEQERLRRAVVEAKEELWRFNQEKAARWQGKLGEAVLVAHRRAPGGGSAFQVAFERETTRFKKIEGRISRRLQSTLSALMAQEAEFRAAVPLVYQEAIQSARRSARVLDESQMTWTRRTLDELEKDLSWKRLPEDYMQLVGIVKEILRGWQGMGGFVEYGLPALAGLLMAMAWVGSTITKDQSQT